MHLERSLIGAEHRAQVVFNVRRVCVVQQQLGGRHQHDDQTREYGRHDTDDERHVVPGTNAVVQPLTVVIKLLYALIARPTVLGPVSRRVDVAQVTLAVLDDVRVLVLVQFGHDVTAAVPAAQLRVRGVDEQRGHVRDDVQEEQAAQREQRGRVQVGPEAGQQHAERAGAERGQHQPAGHLLRMPRHFQPIGPSPLSPGLIPPARRHHAPRRIARSSERGPSAAATTGAADVRRACRGMCNSVAKTANGMSGSTADRDPCAAVSRCGTADGRFRIAHCRVVRHHCCNDGTKTSDRGHRARAHRSVADGGTSSTE